MGRTVPVTFLPHAVTAWVEPGTTVLQAARVAGVPIYAPCGGRAVCGACAVRVVEGELGDRDPTEVECLAHARADARLSCRARVVGPVSVRVYPVDTNSVASLAEATGEPRVAGVDLGTTNVSAVVLEPATGREIGRASVPNRQRSWGADVVSRIAAALDGGAAALQQAAEETVLTALELAAGGSLKDIERITIAGNSAMAALLTGADTRTLAGAPFAAPPIPSHPQLERIRERAPGVHLDVIEPIAAFVGGDILAGLTALNVESYDRPVVLVDIGTNAEVALWAHGRLTVTSAPAGPAFEGGGIVSGGPAVPGAVVRVGLEPPNTLTLETIGSVPATSLCGAGLVSALGLLKALGHLAQDGRLSEDGPLVSRFRCDEAGVLGVRLGTETDPLVLSQLDVRSLQLAKAAVRVAFAGVLSAAGIPASALVRVWVAGAFGGGLAADDLVSLGILPVSVAGAVATPGNTALLGAAALAADPDALVRTRSLTVGVDAVDLAGTPGFADRLMAAVAFAPFDA